MYIGLILILSLFAYSYANNKSIIIIGAGPSGIAAATRLMKNNYTNIKILEAENRIGGRIHSVKVDKSFIDLGGQWCHGEKNNIVYELAKDLNVLHHSKSNPAFVKTSGQLADADVQENLINFLDNQLLGPIGTNLRNVSIADSVLSEFNKILAKHEKDGIEKIEQYKSALPLIKNGVASLEGTFEWIDSPVGSDFEISDGDFEMHWNGRGYKTILDILMQKYPDPTKALPIEDKILLEKEVEAIRYTSKSNEEVEVVCGDGSKYKGDVVVFTPSLGVLKYYSKMFEPELVGEKIEAIDSVGFGAVMKVFLYFDEPWWNDNITAFNLMYTEEELKQLSKEFPSGPTENGRSWLESFTFLMKVEENPNFLLTFLTGNLIPRIEIESERIIQKGMMHVIRKFLGNRYNITEPKYILRTSWFSNPHFLGTYSYDSMHQKYDKSYRKILGDPVLDENSKPKILFAGEATSFNHFSTVHGAIESGFREADRIMATDN